MVAANERRLHTARVMHMEKDNMRTITLFKGLHKYNKNQSEQCWMAEWCLDSRPDPEVLALFSTHILPTAWTWHADASTVSKEIQSLNPDSQVVVRVSLSGP